MHGLLLPGATAPVSDQLVLNAGQLLGDVLINSITHDFGDGAVTLGSENAQVVVLLMRNGEAAKTKVFFVERHTRGGNEKRAGKNQQTHFNPATHQKETPFLQVRLKPDH